MAGDIFHLDKKKVAYGIVILLIIIGVTTIFIYLEYKKTHVSTDDAFVDGHLHIIAPRVPGNIKAVYVTDNQLVERGELLAEIDPADFQAREQEARANLAGEEKKIPEIHSKVQAARTQLKEAIASLAAARANLELQQSNLDLARVNFERAQRLIVSQSIAKSEYDARKTAYDVSVAQVKAAKDNVSKMEAALETQRALVRESEAALPPQDSAVQQKQAALKTAVLNLNYTKIYSPVAGFVTKRSAEVGNQVQTGQPLMFIVPLDIREIWITANYKETELKRVRPGQPVRIKVDMYPDREFRGTVNSIMAGTGAVFSLFPPENATGNYIKVVQRIPVKINLDEDTDPEHLLRIGMSVVPTILVDE